MKVFKKIAKTETIENGEQLGNKLTSLKLKSCKKLLANNKYTYQNILSNYEEFSKAFLRLDDERAEMLLNSLTGLNLLAYKETAAIRGTFKDCKNYNFLTTKDFIAILRVIFHCDKENISSILENLHISFYERTRDVNHQTFDANKLLEKQIGLVLKLNEYVNGYTAANDKIKKSLKDFLVESINILFKITENDKKRDKECFLNIKDEVSIKYQKLQQLAKNTFSHRHIGRRVLADILQIITGAFIVMMPIRAIKGKSLLFSQDKTARQEAIEKIANTVMNPKAG
ncbi:MAG: hypothetical protein LEGION0398_MBIBDBAK_01393 [Legionellaceae bacterium]